MNILTYESLKNILTIGAVISPILIDGKMSESEKELAFDNSKSDTFDQLSEAFSDEYDMDKELVKKKMIYTWENVLGVNDNKTHLKKDLWPKFFKEVQKLLNK